MATWQYQAKDGASTRFDADSMERDWQTLTVTLFADGEEVFIAPMASLAYLKRVPDVSTSAASRRPWPDAWRAGHCDGCTETQRNIAKRAGTVMSVTRTWCGVNYE